MVVVRPKHGKPTLNLDTVLFIERGQRALGHIFDVFGQVSEPYYCVRFNSSEHILKYDIKVGMTVYYCPNTQYTSLVFLNELTK
jgi:H/ACA ribonucleoprotein complex non-core subunit NAF1